MSDTTTPTVDMDTRRRLADRVDTELTRGERETDLSFFDTDDEAVITSYSPTIARSLLRHQKAKIGWVYATGDDEPTGRVRNLATILDSDVRVEGVRARIPKGCLTVKGTVRADNTDSGIVNTPDGADEAREAFADGGRYVLPSPDTVVEDRDKGDRLVVLNTHPTTTAAARTLDNGRTVAEVNPEHDPDAPVVECCYVEEIVDRVDEWRDVSDLRAAVDSGELSKYDFPVDRLGPAEEVAQ